MKIDVFCTFGEVIKLKFLVTRRDQEVKKETWKYPSSFIFLSFLPALLDTGRQKGGNFVVFDWLSPGGSTRKGGKGRK